MSKQELDIQLINIKFKNLASLCEKGERIELENRLNSLNSIVVQIIKGTNHETEKTEI